VDGSRNCSKSCGFNKNEPKTSICRLSQQLEVSFGTCLVMRHEDLLILEIVHLATLLNFDLGENEKLGFF
jgi:hypothetical protein